MTQNNIKPANAWSAPNTKNPGWQFLGHIWVNNDGELLIARNGNVHSIGNIMDKRFSKLHKEIEGG